MATSQFVAAPVSSANAELALPSWCFSADATQLEATTSSSLLPVPDLLKASVAASPLPELSFDGLWDFNQAIEPLLSAPLLTPTVAPVATLQPNADDGSASALGLIGLPTRNFIYPAQECIARSRTPEQNEHQKYLEELSVLAAQPRHMARLPTEPCDGLYARRASTSDVPYYPDTQFFDRNAAALSRSQSVPWMYNNALKSPFQSSYPFTYSMWPRPGMCTPASASTSTTFRSEVSSATLLSTSSPTDLFNGWKGFPQAQSVCTSVLSNGQLNSPSRLCSLSPAQSARRESFVNPQDLYGADEQARREQSQGSSLWPNSLDILAPSIEGCNPHPIWVAESSNALYPPPSTVGVDCLTQPTQNLTFDSNHANLLERSVSLTENFTPRIEDVVARPAKRRSSPNVLETNWQGTISEAAVQATEGVAPSQPIDSASTTLQVGGGPKSFRKQDIPATFKGRRWGTVKEWSIVEKHPAVEGPAFYQIKFLDGTWGLCEYIQFIGLQRVTRFQCACHKAYYGRQENLTRHMNEGVRTHTCPQCNKDFGREDNLKQHCSKVHGFTLPTLNSLLVANGGTNGCDSAVPAPCKKRRRKTPNANDASLSNALPTRPTPPKTSRSRSHGPSRLGRVVSTAEMTNNPTIPSVPIVDETIWTNEVMKWGEQVAPTQFTST